MAETTQTRTLDSVRVQQIEYKSTAEQVAGALREMILRGELSPGAPLEETRCSEAFGVSRNTIREAIRALGQAGLVVHARRRPSVVTQLTAPDVDDVFTARRVIELGAVAALDPAAADFGDLEHALDELLIVSESRDWYRLAEADLGFHAAIVALAGSPRLERAFHTLEAEVRLCLTLTDRWDTNPSDQIAQHQRLYDLLHGGETEACIEELGKHVDDARSRVMAVLAHTSDAAAGDGARDDEQDRAEGAAQDRAEGAGHVRTGGKAGSGSPPADGVA